MNPSARGWIRKLLKDNSIKVIKHWDCPKMYRQLKSTGFIYGSNIRLIYPIGKTLDLSEEERCKINLLLSFYVVYENVNCNEAFVESLIDYYKTISQQKQSFFDELFPEKASYNLLEKIIQKRIHIDDNFLSKSFNYFLINALLFVDVLGYQQFLKAKPNIKNFVNDLECNIETVVFSVIEAKTHKSEYDNNLIKLFKSSVRHKNHKVPSYKEAAIHFEDLLEKYYVIDLVCMASWSDKRIDKDELAFLNQLQSDLNLDTQVIEQSIDDINGFFYNHKDKVAFLSSKNLAQSLYDNSSKVVIKLIKRNSKRLIRELSESKEAMSLLAQSTQRHLSDDEHKKIQSQLLDIFKSIPSLAIFILPGGMILLPLFVKFIPQLLPSAFDENRIDSD